VPLQTARRLRAPRFSRLDASENAYFANQLEHIKAGLYNRKLPALKARGYVPLDTETPADADTVKIRGYTQVGVAKLISAYADDLPRADVKAEEMVANVKGLGASYGYDINEVRRSARTGVNLPTQKAAAAQRAVEVAIDGLLAVGNVAHGLYGLLNQPNALSYTVENGGGGTADWASKTPEEILKDMIGLCEYIVNQTAEVEQPNMLLMPRAQFTQIKTTRFSDSSDKTIFDWFKASYPGVGVDSWAKLATAGAGNGTRMVAYTMSPEHLAALIPQDFEQLPPEPRGLEFVVPCHARCGGVVAYYPLSIAYGDGI
jgi:hypothetical protein